MRYLWIISAALCLILSSSACKQECTFDCSTNTKCIKGECQCDREDMIKVLRGTGPNPRTIACIEPFIADWAWVYKASANSCICMEDLIIYFYNCGVPDPTLPFEPVCQVTAIYIDPNLNMYRNINYDVTGFFPALRGSEDRTVSFEWSTFTADVPPFCNIGDERGIRLDGEVSEDLDTIQFVVTYFDDNWEPARANCPVTFVRQKKPN